MRKLTDDLLAAYEDGELSDEDRTFVDAELQRDPEARARLEAFRSVSVLVRAAHADGAGTRTELAPPEQEPQPRCGGPVRRISGTLAIAVIILVLAIAAALYFSMA